MKSWKTTSAGILAIIGAAVALWYQRADLSAEVIMIAVTAVLAGIGLMFARDNDQTSEDVAAPHAGVTKTRGPLLALVSALFLGAMATGCGTLDKEGVYAGDEVLHNTELTITTSYDVIHTFVTWENENRAALAQYPELTRAADAMRAGAPQWFKTAHALRDAYAADPTPENRDQLQTALRLLRAALTEAASYMAIAASQPDP